MTGPGGQRADSAAGGSRRRRDLRPVVVGLLVGAVIAALIVVWAVRRDGDDGGGPVVTATSAAAPVDDGSAAGEPLSLDSRLGYAGLGPIGWGMTPDEIRRAGGIEFTVDDACGVGSWPALSTSTSSGVFGWLDADGRLSTIRVGRPEVRTISGVHVGSTEDEVRATYPSVVAETGRFSSPMLVLVDPGGRTLLFHVQDGVVRSIAAGPTREAADALSSCD